MQEAQLVETEMDILITGLIITERWILIAWVATYRITICPRIGLLNTLNLSDFKDNVKNRKSKTKS